MKKEVIKQLIEARLKKDGLQMRKLITRGSYGLFYSFPAQYDYKIARSLEEEQQLSKEGYSVDDNLGLLLWNALTEAVY